MRSGRGALVGCSCLLGVGLAEHPVGAKDMLADENSEVLDVTLRRASRIAACSSTPRKTQSGASWTKSSGA